MEMLVGFSLTAFSLWMMLTLIREWNGFELRSKWSLALDGLSHGCNEKITVGHAGWIRRYYFNKTLS
ncbi:hypothetical protein VN24_23125 [Paenibacillus beijingensis]|uniref:Uncharacterized protein n=1 Tax=Paenibacillus beijingensis TaxID=1126833 RepID=A0A0D5NPI2_9BACL|nr:hypothetical protein VN24_23125 [Paenibacillus beijingensis]